MLIQTGTKPSHTAGPLDVLCILHDTTVDRYHVAFFEEAPMPGPIGPVEALSAVRLKSRMHHTEGAPTLDGALEHLDTMLAEQIELPESNVCREPFPWDGSLGLVWLVPNWRRLGGQFGS